MVLPFSAYLLLLMWSPQSIIT